MKLWLLYIFSWLKIFHFLCQNYRCIKKVYLHNLQMDQPSMFIEMCLMALPSTSIDIETVIVDQPQKFLINKNGAAPNNPYRRIAWARRSNSPIESLPMKCLWLRRPSWPILNNIQQARLQNCNNLMKHKHLDAGVFFQLWWRGVSKIFK